MIIRLIKARVKGYHSILDTGYFEVEELKTILVAKCGGKDCYFASIAKIESTKKCRPI